MAAKADKLVVFEGAPRDGHRRFYWKVVARNGQDVGGSRPQSYTRRNDALRAGRHQHPDLTVIEHQYRR